MVIAHKSVLRGSVERTVQYLMILLAVTVLILPIAFQPEEAEAVGPLVVVIVGGAFVLGGVVLNHVLNSCSECGKGGVGEAHRSTCPKGHVYYNCRYKGKYLSI